MTHTNNDYTNPSEFRPVTVLMYTEIILYIITQTHICASFLKAKIVQKQNCQCHGNYVACHSFKKISKQLIMLIFGNNFCICAFQMIAYQITLFDCMSYLPLHNTSQY